MRRVTPIGAVLLVAGAANADPTAVDAWSAPDHRSAATWWELGALHVRNDLGNHTVLAGDVSRFGVRVVFARHFYAGGELDIGRISDHIAADGAARMLGVTSAGPVSGTIAAVHAVAGVRATSGMVTAGIELATGVRHSDARTSYGIQLADVTEAPALDGRTRVDVWLTPHLTIGASASIDLLVPSEIAVGLFAGWHFAAFDYGL